MLFSLVTLMTFTLTATKAGAGSLGGREVVGSKRKSIEPLPSSCELSQLECAFHTLNSLLLINNLKQIWFQLCISASIAWWFISWWDLTWSTVSRYGVLSTGEMGTSWSTSRGGLQNWSQGWNTSLWGQAESWGCVVWRREGSRETQ